MPPHRHVSICAVVLGKALLYSGAQYLFALKPYLSSPVVWMQGREGFPDLVVKNAAPASSQGSR